MKNFTLPPMVRILAAPVCQMLLGLVLLCRPSILSVLAGTVLGWVLLAAGIAVGIVTLCNPRRSLTQAFLCAVLVCLGCWLLKRPGVLTTYLGRMVGVLLLLSTKPRPQEDPRTQKLINGVLIALGLALIILPMTTSALIFKVLGALVLVAGGAELVARLRYVPPASGKPDIIDAE